MNEHLETLVKVYNSLLLVSTKGEDTIIMGNCLSTMRAVLEEMLKQNNVPFQAE